MKIEFKNSIRRLSILRRLPDIKIAWINPWCYVTICYPVCDVRNLEIKLSSLNMFFFFRMTKKSGQIFKSLENGKSF